MLGNSIFAEMIKLKQGHLPDPIQLVSLCKGETWTQPGTQGAGGRDGGVASLPREHQRCQRPLEAEGDKTQVPGSSLVAQQVKEPVLSLLWLWLELWLRFNPWPGNSTCLGHGQKKKKKKN